MAVRFAGTLKELRIHLCQTSKQSAGVREFIQTNYLNIKKANPGFPILIRECSGVEPKVWARYDGAQETVTPLCDFTASQVEAVFKKFAK